MMMDDLYALIQQLQQQAATSTPVQSVPTSQPQESATSPLSVPVTLSQESGAPANNNSQNGHLPIA
jgi:hypothetical protein